MKSLGEQIRKLRESQDIPLRIISAFLDVDPAILSKIERGQRRATKEQVIKLAGYFKVDKDELIVAWLSDKIVHEMEDEEQALKALHVAEQKIKYSKK